MAATESSNPALEALAKVLRHGATRAALSVAIVVSLLPILEYPVVDGIMLVVFALEFVARAILLIRREGLDPELRCEDDAPYRIPSLIEVALLGVDLVALLSFVPWQTALANARWLRVFRLARLLLLFRYWAPVAKEMWPVVVRHERGRQVALLGVLVLVASFTGAVVLDHVLTTPGADFDGDEAITEHDAQFWSRMWWAFRQVQDPGNMLASPNNAIAIVVSLGLTVLGLFLVSFLIGLGTDVVRELLERSRLRPPGLVGHTVVFNYSPATRILLSELTRHYDKMLGGTVVNGFLQGYFERVRQRLDLVRSGNRYVVVGHGDTPPDGLRAPALSRVVWRAASPDHELMLTRSDVAGARRVILLADANAPDPDDATIRTVLAISERVTRPETDPTRVVAEILDESNVPAARMAIKRVGEKLYGSLVPTERLLGLYVAAIARVPEIQYLLDELMTTRGSEIYSFDYAYPHHEHKPSNVLLEGEFSTIFEDAFVAGLRESGRNRVIAIGVVSDEIEAYRPRLYLEPRGTDGEGARIRGFVGLTTSFSTMERFAASRKAAAESKTSATPDDASAKDSASTMDALASVLQGAEGGGRTLTKILICGWRPGSVNLVEALMVANDAAEVLIMVDGDGTVAGVLDDFDSHANLVRRKMLHGRRSHFVVERAPQGGSAPAAVLRLVDVDARSSLGRVVVRTGDRTSTRALADLGGNDAPTSLTTVSEVDVVILLGDPRTANDARTVTSMMKIESIVAQQCRIARSDESLVRRGHALRLIAEVEDEELARRLSTARTTANGRRGEGELHDVDDPSRVEAYVFSIQQLRARFLYQSVVVPHFYGIFAELLAPLGRSIVGVDLAPNRGRETTTLGMTTFAALAHDLWRRGEGILMGADLGRKTGIHRTLLGEGEDPRTDAIDLDDVQRLWLIRRDPVEARRGVGE